MLLTLALLAQAKALQVQAPQPNNPTAQDKATLLQAAAKCHLPPGAAYFVQFNIPPEPTMHVAAGSEQQFLCVMNALPRDFHSRFGLEAPEPR